jgi:putative ABC transport system permease protein
MTVVGVYDVSRGLPGMMWNGAEVRGAQPPKFYTARGKHWRADQILVRTRGPADPFLPSLRRFLRESAPALPVTQVLTLAQIDEREYGIAVRISMLAGSGGVVALLLASLGLYGVVSLAVQQRRREIGIRIAIGAQPMQVARMFLASGVRVSVVALLLGLPLSIAGLHVAVREGGIIIPRTNVILLGGGIAALLLAVASAATWVPARRAAQVDPSMTLRVE